MSIAHAIVRAHGGSIDVENSASGTGCLFRALLPVLQSKGQAAPENAEPQPLNQTLFVIDDDQAVRGIVRRQAQRRGWTVHEASSAEDALGTQLETLEASSAVLCDMKMPGMGGVGFYDRLCQDRPHLVQRIVFYTGDFASHASIAFAKRSMRPLLPKPLDFDEMFMHLAGAGRTDFATSELKPKHSS
ncbi:MAG: CheY-like chemotaxis protein [Planctomycetota bacterium]